MGSAAAYARARETILRICRGEADARTLRLEALDAIRRTVGFDAYAWLLTDPETSVGSSPLADVPCLPQLPRLIRLKYATAVNRWTGLPSAAASLYETTGGTLSLSLMWRELLSQYQVTDIASPRARGDLHPARAERQPLAAGQVHAGHRRVVVHSGFGGEQLRGDVVGAGRDRCLIPGLGRDEHPQVALRLRGLSPHLQGG